MKKFSALLLCGMMIASTALTACGGQGPEEPAVQTVTGTGTMTWHGDVTFVAAVDVAFKGDVIESVSVREGSAVTTDAFDGWLEGKEAYLAQYTGKTVEQISALEVSGPENPSDHNDGGSVSGEIDAIAGATASSTVVAMAVKDAAGKVGEA